MVEGKTYTAAITRNFITHKSHGLRIKEFLLPFILVINDYAAIFAAIMTAHFVVGFLVSLFPGETSNLFYLRRWYLYMMMPLPYILFTHFDHLYTRRLLFWQQVEKIFKVSVYAVISNVVLLYMTNYSMEMSRLFFIMVWAFSFMYLVISRFLLKNILIFNSLWQIPVVLIGAGKTAELLVTAFKRDSGLGYKVVGLVEDNPEAGKLIQYPLLGTFDRAEEVVKRTGVKDVLIAAPGLNRAELLDLVYRLQPFVKNIAFVPDLFGVPVGDMQLDTLFNEKAVLLRIRNNLASGYNRILKYSFDFISALLGFFGLIPVMAIISLLIYINCPGPVIFSHKRIGKSGQEFSCYKFRTMVINADAELEQYIAGNPTARQEWERYFKLKNDPRVTRIGKFLRRTSLDELPQLLNVLKGEMSLVGPRPIVADEIQKYEKNIYDYYLVRPGITGMWQVDGRSDVSYEERVQLDSWYVRNWSLWLDVILLVRTIGVVTRGKGAY